MLTMLKMSVVMAATTIAILAGDYCYKQSLVQPGEMLTASIRIASGG